MVSVSRIILLQSSRPWRACEKRPSTRKLTGGLRKKSDVDAQPLKGRLISMENGIAEAMP
jgi:hypothetical protein